MTEAITTAVAQRDNSPRALVADYREDFAAVLPSHVKAATWVRLAQGALKKGKKVGKPGGGYCTELELAANNNPTVFLASLLEAARLGLEPGTEQYYLTPRKVKKQGGGYQLEILGIVGYQGFIELMYRAGAISSVVAECVYADDEFQFQPGVDERPRHIIDWDAEDRGRLRLVYAYAVMKDGATSKVVVLNRAAIEKIKASSQGASSEYSPWQKHEDSMWLKSAVRQVAKWVPTSAEYMREQLRAVQEVAAEQGAPFAPAPAGTHGQPIDVTGMLIEDEDVLDGEVVADEVVQ
jgi:recombination protein RecT